LTTLTERQQLVLDFIEAFIRIKGYPPCLREIAEGLNMKSRSNIHRIVHKLQNERYVRMIPLQSRTLKVLNRG
jgi:repressor LexA